MASRVTSFVEEKNNRLQPKEGSYGRSPSRSPAPRTLSPHSHPVPGLTRTSLCPSKLRRKSAKITCSPNPLIDSVAISHEGNYTCQIVTPDGNFHSTYQLEVLVPPEVTTGNRSRTTMCSAAAGKPAAQISWAPQGACVSTEQKQWDNDTLTTVQSICHMAENVSTVNCSVFHLTGNKTISIGDFAREDSSSLLYFCFSSIFIVILIIIWFLKSICCRKCKWKEREDSLVVEEDEMQPYASYTEKNNPLYDTTDRTKTSQA